jgi:hypothetical protein
MEGNQMRKILSVFVLMLLISSYTLISQAEILSDPVFDSISVTISTSKTVIFDATTFEEHSSIEITRVRLYKKISNVWTYQGDLPLPTNVSVMSDNIYATADYSSYIGTGTYRLYTTFSADGYNVSRYSNTRTY